MGIIDIPGQWQQQNLTPCLPLSHSKHKHFFMKKLFVLAFAALILGSCNKDDQALIDRGIILDYLAATNLDATEHESGIFYVIDTPGHGGNPTINAEVTVRYKGYYLDGQVFDETKGSETRSWPLYYLIEGWQISIPLLEKGGKGLFLIPSGLAYGSNPPQGVRKDAVMAFEIELVDFK